MATRLFKTTLFMSALLTGAILASGILVSTLTEPGSQMIFNNNVEDFWHRFYYMFAVAILIERSVEIYLQITALDGHAEKSAAQVATAAAFILAALLAIVGLRILETLITLDVASASNNPLATTLFFGVDVLVSAGLMAGGAVVFHPLIQFMTTPCRS